MLTETPGNSNWLENGECGEHKLTPSIFIRKKLGKGTLARLNSTPSEREAREAKLADAVRTLLECIGEDPDRDGLVKTPERYAKALLWMTKGYEERLPGASPPSPTVKEGISVRVWMSSC